MKEIGIVTNKPKTNFYNELKYSFKTCISFKLCVAFINFSGLQLLINSLNDVKERNIKGQILTSTYLNFTDPTSLKKLQVYSNIETKVFKSDHEGFHSKGYIFEYADNYIIFIGSSNITQSALRSNIEWNSKIIVSKNDIFAQSVIKEFDDLFAKDESTLLNDDFIKQYENIFEQAKKIAANLNPNLSNITFVENEMQIKATKALAELRTKGETKALVVSATGTGKTYMSAFDVRNVNPHRMLYLVHNGVILKDAIKTFKNVCKNRSFGVLSGSQKDFESDFLFSTIQTFSKQENLRRFSPKSFDYIIIDEAHRCAAKSYHCVFDYFKPSFLLGMTATPERTDGENIYELFDYNVAIDIRLAESINKSLVVPFHYFGISDIEELDGVDVTENIDKLAEILMVNKRVNLIVENINKFKHDGYKTKALAFCATVKHAEYMAEKFNELGYTSVAITGQTPIDQRKNYIDRLQNNLDPLSYLFTVDAFNEGVDIPGVNLVLMLRPTSSSIIFTQELGRGLRKDNDKNFLTVIDFIANQDRAFLIPVALCGGSTQKSSIIQKAADGFPDLAKNVFVTLDEKAREVILNKLENVNFAQMKFLKQEYLDFKQKFVASNTHPSIFDFVVHGQINSVLNFIKCKRNYLSFIKSAEKDDSYDEILNNINSYTFLNVLSGYLPIKHPLIFVIFKILFEKGIASDDEIKELFYKYSTSLTNERLQYTKNYICNNYYSENERKHLPTYFVKGENKIMISPLLENILSNSVVRENALDLVNSGLEDYKEQFGKEDYGFPFLKPFQQYSRTDLSSLFMNKNSPTSLTMSGGTYTVIKNKEYFFFVTMNKDETAKDKNQDYNDYFIDQNTFHWESPNASMSSKGTGYIYCHNDDIGANIHLFVQKESGLNYYYLGKVHALKYENEKPIAIVYRLENTTPNDIYEELIFERSKLDGEKKN